MPNDFIEKITSPNTVLYDKLIDTQLYTVTLEFPYYDMEGDLALVFKINGSEISSLSFTIINGHMVDIDSGHVILIARVQGVNGCCDSIKHATKAFNDVTPNTVPAIATQAIATALNIGRIVGITTSEHIILEAFSYNYDALWISMAGDNINSKVFCIPVHPTHKPITAIKRNHRSRSKHKRQFKLDIYNQVILAFEQQCLNLL